MTTEKRKRIIEHSTSYRCYLTPLGNLSLDERCFFPNYERYIIPEGAIKSQVKSLSLEDVLTQVNRDLGVSSIYKIIYVVHNL